MLSGVLHFTLSVCVLKVMADIDDLDYVSYQNSEIVYPHAMSVTHKNTAMRDENEYLMEVSSGMTPTEYANLICAGSTSIMQKDCVATAMKRSVIAVRNTAVSEVTVRNGFGHTAFYFQTPDYKVRLYAYW